jgi:hypothetical protein
MKVKTIKSVWGELFERILKFGVKLSVEEGEYIRECLRNAYLKGKIEGLEEVVEINQKLRENIKI